MGNNEFDSSMNLEHELAQKAGELAAQRREREQKVVTLILERIVGGIVSKDTEIAALMTATKGRCQKEIMQIVEKEVIRSSDGSLWNPDYNLRPHGEQLIYCYTENYWKKVEPAMW